MRKWPKCPHFNNLVAHKSQLFMNQTTVARFVFVCLCDAIESYVVFLSFLTHDIQFKCKFKTWANWTNMILSWHCKFSRGARGNIAYEERLDALAHGIQSLRRACRENLTSRLRSLTLWQVFKIESSISSVASLALSNCCWKGRERETKIERELNTLQTEWFSTNRTCTSLSKFQHKCQCGSSNLKDGLCKTWQSLSAVFSSEDRQTGGWDCFQMGLRWGVNTNTAHKPCECLKRSHLLCFTLRHHTGTATVIALQWTNT